MTEKTIQDSVRDLFINHKYLLTNSYVFSWESDFFSITKSLNCYEVEIKISKSDFKKDFEKQKHQLFSSIVSGKKLVVAKTNQWENGDVIVRSKDVRLKFRKNWIKEFDESFIHEEDSFGYWQQRDKYCHLIDVEIDYRAPVSRIEIIDLSKRVIPNRFYYACPENLISIKEVPEYAGLIWVGAQCAVIIKQAPFITKEDVFSKIQGVLLQKFWFLSERQRRVIRWNEYKNIE